MKAKAEIAVLYHADCADGFGAATAAWMSLGDAAIYFPVQYGSPPPAEAWEVQRLYILDFSYDRPTMTDLADRLGEDRVLCLDHHKSAREALAGLPFATFDMDRSGAVQAWEYFHPGKAVPLLIQYVQDRDLWQWQLPQSREFSAALSIQPRDFQAWSHHAAILEDPRAREAFCRAGAAILSAQRQHVDTLASRPYWVEISGHRVPAVNCPLFQSELGERLCELHPDADFAAVYFDLSPQEQVWSLRSRNGFDVSTVAKSLGGGGHAAAAGFRKIRSGHDEESSP